MGHHRIIAWSPNSRYAYGQQDDRDWRLDTAADRLQVKIRELSFPIDADWAVNDAGQIVLASAGPEGGSLKLIDWETGKEQLLATGSFRSVMSGRDASLFVCAKMPENLSDAARGWEVWLGRLRGGAWCLSQVRGIYAPEALIALSPDSKRLAYVDTNDEVRVVPITAE